MAEPSGEFAYIDWLRRQTVRRADVAVGPGDDTAVVRWTPGPDCLVTTDMLLEGSCFRLAEAGPRRVGRKAMAVNLSDIAAMAGRPIAAVVSLGLPRAGGRNLAEELYRGTREVADSFDVAIVGGDTNSWDGGLVISITVMGQPTGRGPVLRRGARPGDWLMVTGSFGGSIRGKHLDFTPRVAEAMRLHELVELRAMIDVSDGLTRDVWHLCEESGCGAAFVGAAVPRSPHAGDLAAALGDGEDFELAFSVAPEDGKRLLDLQPLGDVPVSHIGQFVESGLWLDGQPIEPQGYIHTID